MGFLHTLTRLVEEKRSITSQQKEKEESIDESKKIYKYYEDDVIRKRVIKIDHLHSRATHLLRKIEFHVKHYLLGNITYRELKIAFSEVEHALNELLVIEVNTIDVLSKEERKRIAQSYYEKLNMLKKICINNERN